MRILLSGGSGLIGSKLRDLSDSIIAPSHAEMDVTRAESVQNAVSQHQPDIFIHAAGLVGIRECRENSLQCLEVNCLGTFNVLHACFISNTRMVYISSEYVFDGERGNYAETDLPNPITEYAKSKVASEMMVSNYPNGLIIRTTFCSGKKWKFEAALIDQYTSRDTVDVIAPEVLEAAESPLTGILHIGTERKSQYELAKRIDPTVKAINRAQVNVPLPKDTSLNCNRWRQYKSENAVQKMI